MKRFFAFSFLALFAMLLLSLFCTPFLGNVMAQTLTADTDVQIWGGHIYSLTAADIDSGESASAYFELNRYDHVSWSTYGFPFTLDYTGTESSPDIDLRFYGSLNNGVTWTAIDSIISITQDTSGTLSFGNKKYPAYKGTVTATDGDSAYAFVMRWWAYQDQK